MRCGYSVEGWSLEKELFVIVVASVWKGEYGSGKVFYANIACIRIVLGFEETEMGSGVLVCVGGRALNDKRRVWYRTEFKRFLVQTWNVFR